MTNNLDKLFVIGGNPLVMPEEINVDFIYVNEHGDIIKVLVINEIDNSIDYRLIQKSELVDGELITDLDTKLLDLFWRLTRNNSGKTTPYEDDCD